MKRAATVDDYIAGASHWRDELIRLRRILQRTELEEAVKWGAPCYTLDGKNVVGLGAFQSYVGLWFFQGALLADEQQVLVNAQQGKTKVMRQWRFRSAREIDSRQIRAYVREAIEIQRQGREIRPERGKPLTLPDELAQALRTDTSAGACFRKLTPGRQREYAEHVGSAKRPATRLARVEKVLPLIRAGVGLNDKYRNC